MQWNGVETQCSEQDGSPEVEPESDSSTSSGRDPHSPLDIVAGATEHHEGVTGQFVENTHQVAVLLTKIFVKNCEINQ